MNSEVIILARLNNGDIHMLGDADRGAEIGENVEASSGKAVTDNNGAGLYRRDGLPHRPVHQP